MSPNPALNAATATGTTTATATGTPPGAAADAMADLARVQGKVEAARAVLLRLLQEVVVAESRLNGSQAAQLLEANERLVVAALRERAEARAATQSLTDVTRLAEKDPLTGLPNRALLLDRSAQAIATAKRRGGRLALLFVDLDDFKQINDRLGHVAGDDALQRVALRLGQSIREVDTVSRYGGDEFVILLTEVSQAGDAALIAGKLLAALAEPLHVGDRDLHLTASIGISVYPDDGDTIEALIGHADAAMYRAKRQGPGRIALHGDAAPAPSSTSSSTSPATSPPLAPPRSPRPATATATEHEQALAAHERRHAELQEANEHLVLATLDAQALQAAAEQAQQRQADLMAAVAEELGNPYTPIRLAAAMVGLAADDKVLLPRAQALVDQQAARRARLVAAATARSRAAGMLMAPGSQTCDLVAVIDATVRAADAVLKLRHQHLTVAVPAGPVTVRGDAERLGHVLGNLLDNASKYTPDNGSIWLDAAVRGGSAEVVVSDDGIGIAAAVVAHIFEPFGQDSRALGFNGASTGIGLPVVRALVTDMGGTVTADSAGSGHGSRFVVTLPLAEGGAADAPGARPGRA